MGGLKRFTDVNFSAELHTPGHVVAWAKGENARILWERLCKSAPVKDPSFTDILSATSEGPKKALSKLTYV